MKHLIDIRITFQLFIKKKKTFNLASEFNLNYEILYRYNLKHSSVVKHYIEF